MTGPQRHVPPPQTFSGERASVFLRMGMTGPRKPVDDLADRLAARDGGAWLVRILQEGPLKGLGSPEQLLVEGQADRDQLQSIKERSKALVKGGQNVDARSAGVAGYFLTAAAALVHHGWDISSRPKTELTEAFVELASASPQPWRDLLTRAAGIAGGH